MINERRRLTAPQMDEFELLIVRWITFYEMVVAVVVYTAVGMSRAGRQAP